jgi:hypothetical protein
MFKRARRLALIGSAAAFLWSRRDDVMRLIDRARSKDPAFAGDAERAAREAPSDRTTVTELLDGAEQRGYSEQFVLAGDGVRCLLCREVRPASEYAFESLRRLEGASDPDDSQAVLAVHCPVCDAAGSLVLNYGFAASPEESDALAAMQDRRGDSGIPTGAAPGESGTSPS